jgi:hypothetical protein
VVTAQRAESLDVLVAWFAAGRRGDVIEGALGVDRVVENDGVDDQAERAELLFLALAVGLAELAAAAMADVAGEAVAAFAAVELDEDPPAEVLVVAVVEEVDRLRKPRSATSSAWMFPTTGTPLSSSQRWVLIACLLHLARVPARKFARDFNEHWLLERHGYRSPANPRRPHLTGPTPRLA